MVRLFETYDGNRVAIGEGSSVINAMLFFKQAYEQDGAKIINKANGFSAIADGHETIYSIEEV